MKENTFSILNDPIYKPVVLYFTKSLTYDSGDGRISEKKLQDLSFQFLRNLDVYQDSKGDTQGFEAGLNVDDINFRNSIENLKENGIIDVEDGKVLLTEAGLEIYEVMVDQLNQISTIDVLNYFKKHLNNVEKKIENSSEKNEKKQKEMVKTLRKFGGQIDQHFPNYLSNLESDILKALYRIGCFDKDKILKFSGKRHRNSIYNALKKMESKGFVFNTGKGYVNYKLTKIGKNQARILIADEYP